MQQGRAYSPPMDTTRLRGARRMQLFKKTPFPAHQGPIRNSDSMFVAEDEHLSRQRSLGNPTVSIPRPWTRAVRLAMTIYMGTMSYYNSSPKCRRKAVPGCFRFAAPPAPPAPPAQGRRKDEDLTTRTEARIVVSGHRVRISQAGFLYMRGSRTSPS